MDAKELSAFLASPKLTARETLLGLTGGAIALLLIAAGTIIYKRDYRDGLLCLVVATLLGFAFFRKRKVALVVSGCTCILALVFFCLPFRPSLPGLALLLGPAAALFLTARWQYKKYPYLTFRHLHTLFEGEEAMAAENARIEAEARELVKKRPYGPWLFR